LTISGQPKLGLRERKKIKTRQTIQQHALRLFRKQGYNETTIEQIAEAAEISPSTFFRYFPTKEALVLDDDYDPLLIQQFASQPSDISPLHALRNAVRTGLSLVPEEGRNAFRERMILSMNVPEIRAASLIQLMDTMRMVAKMIADRTGRTPDDFYVLTLAGSFVGSVMSTQLYAANHPDEDYADLIDKAIAQLEVGLAIPNKAES